MVTSWTERASHGSRLDGRWAPWRTGSGSPEPTAGTTSGRSANSPDAVEAYCTEDFVSHEPGQTIEGRAAYREFEAELRRAMPDLEGSIDFVVAEDGKVAECWHEYDRLAMMQQLGVVPENPTA